MSRGRILVVLASIVVTSVGLRAELQGTPDNPVTDAVRAVVPEHEHDILEAFRIMPDDKYGFRPTPELMTFSELAMHIAGANFYYCRTLAGPDAPRHSLAKTTAPKAELLKVLEASLTFCDGVVRQSRDTNLSDVLLLPGTTDKMTRARILIELVSGMDHHYGQAAAYLRLNGLVPPTARPPKIPSSDRWTGFSASGERVPLPISGAP